MGYTSIRTLEERLKVVRQAGARLSNLAGAIRSAIDHRDRQIVEGKASAAIQTGVQAYIDEIEDMADYHASLVSGLEWTYADRVEVNPELGYANFTITATDYDIDTESDACTASPFEVFASGDIVKLTGCSESDNEGLYLEVNSLIDSGRGMVFSNANVDYPITDLTDETSDGIIVTLVRKWAP